MDGERLAHPAAAYRNDPTFRAVVDALGAILDRAQLTPAEVRSAAMLACIHYEQRTVRPHIRPTGSREEDDRG